MDNYGHGMDTGVRLPADVARDTAGVSHVVRRGRGGSHAYRRVIAYRWSESDALLRRRAVTSGPQRLAGLLVGLAERLGGQAEGIIELALPLSQEELASLAGTSRATVARALSDWRKRGLIQTGQRRMTLTDVAGLRRVAGLARPAPLPG